MAARIKSLKPLFTNVLVKKPSAITKTAGGIVLPETAKQKLNWGTVLEVGPGRRDKTGVLIPVQVKKGDTVMLGEWGSQTVKVNDEELHIVKEEDILGVLELENKQ